MYYFYISHYYYYYFYISFYYYFLPLISHNSSQKDDIIRTLEGPKGRIQRLLWTDLNRTLISVSEDGYVRRWDVEVCS